MNEHEAKFLKKILRSRKAEALKWLLAETPASLRALGELAHDPAIAFVRKIYDLGAVKVLAVEIEDWARGESANALIIELPADPDARQRIFELNQKMAEIEGFDGDADEGQQHLLVKVKSERIVDVVLGRGRRRSR